MEYLELPINKISVNGIEFQRVLIDWKHISARHPDIHKSLVLTAADQLNGKHFVPDKTKHPYQYFVSMLSIERKSYRLIWLIEKNNDYLGIINLYRDDRKK